MARLQSAAAVVAARRQRLALRTARWTGTAARWSAVAAHALFAPAAAAAVSAGLGQLAGHVFGRGLAPWVALTVAGGFGLWMATELNTPPAPRQEDSEV